MDWVRRSIEHQLGMGRMKKNNNGVEVESLAARIKRLRMASGLTQGQLATSVGISKTAVTNWEAGEVPRGRNLTKLAVAFRIDVAALLGESPLSLDELVEEVRLLAAFRVLPKERQLIAIKLLEALRMTDN